MSAHPLSAELRKRASGHELMNARWEADLLRRAADSIDAAAAANAEMRRERDDARLVAIWFIRNHGNEGEWAAGTGPWITENAGWPGIDCPLTDAGRDALAYSRIVQARAALAPKETK